MAVAGVRVRVGSWHPSHFPGLVGPAVAAVVATAILQGMAGIRDLLRRMVRWQIRSASCVVAVAAPLALLLVGLLVSRALGRSPRVAELGLMNGLPETSPVALWLVLTTWNGFGEETGWRGFALPRLAKRYGPARGTLLLALAWAGWHAPMFFVLDTYRSLGPAMLPGFVLGLTAGALLLTWLYHRTDGSILAVAVWHGTFNFATATQGTRGLIAALVSTVVMFWGTTLALLEIRALRRGAPSVIGAVAEHRAGVTLP